MAELAAIQQRLEGVDEDENPLERELKRDRLLQTGQSAAKPVEGLVENRASQTGE